MDNRVESGSYLLYYHIEDGGAVITGYEGAGSRMFIPDRVGAGGEAGKSHAQSVGASENSKRLSEESKSHAQSLSAPENSKRLSEESTSLAQASDGSDHPSAKGYPVTGLGKKAILANKSLREISLPGSIRKVDDWAMAQCENMQTVVLRGEAAKQAAETAHSGAGQQSTLSASYHIPELTFGRGVFDNCHKIKDICLGYEEPDELSALLGAVIYRMPAEYLLKDKDLGRPEWFGKWDQCLLTYLNEPDLDGYTDMVLCGEEDIFYQEPDFAVNKRKKKSALCLLRLLNCRYMAQESRKRYIDYILAHTKGAASEEAWEVLLEEFGENVDYYRLFAEIGGVTKENIDAMLADMGERYAESKAFLLNYKQTKFGGEDVFSMFRL